MIEKIDPMTWLWMYMSWIQDIEDKHEFATDYSIFLGSFSNMEAAQKMLDRRNPQYVSTDEEFEKATKKVIEEGKKLKTKDANKSLHRRKRKVIAK